MEKNNFGLKAKLTIPIVGIFIASIALILIITLSIASKNINKISLELMNETNMHYASVVQGKINASMDSVKTLKVMVEEFAQQGGYNREKVIEILGKVIEDNDNIFGAYTIWEPNAFDGNDNEYKNKPGYDETGRLIPYVVRSDTGIIVEPLAGYETEGDGDYYLLPKKTKEECIIDPFIYETGGKKMFMTSIVIPIIIDGKFVGIVGQDILVDTLISEVEGTKIYDSGYLFLTDSNGNIFSHPNETTIGNQVYDYMHESVVEELRNSINTGVSTSFDSYSQLVDKDLRYKIDPVSVGRNNWWVGSTAPVNEILKPTTDILIYGIASGVITAIIISIILIIIISSILMPIKNLIHVINKLSVGDIDVDVTATTKDEIGELMHAFGILVESTRRQAALVEKIADGDMTVNAEIRSDKDVLGNKLTQMLDRLNELLSNISNASQQVAAGSRQVSDSSVQLSQGATEQASSLEELTSSVEEISAQTKHNADNALEANNIAENAKTAAETGSEQMSKMLSAMDDINESSSNINKIIKVIDDIAFQTNILALNAAVEAARAGQQGKGFAVVAEEVRNLASKSANAAKETAALIEGSIKKVEGGTKIAASTSSSLKEIVGSVTKVAKLVGDIAVASNEQASGIAQINQGLMQVSQVVQSNSATSEESAAASEELTSQAEMLRRQVESFKLRNASGTYNSREEASLSSDMNDIIEKMKTQKKLPVNGSTPTVKKNISLGNSNYGKY